MKNNKIMTIFISTIVVVLFSVWRFYQRYNNPELKLIKNNITLKYGQKLLKELNQYVDTSLYKNNNILSGIKHGYDINYIYYNSTINLKVIIKDTTTPVLSLKNSFKIFENNETNYDDYITVKEISDYKITISDDTINHNTPGRYTANATVIDEYR